MSFRELSEHVQLSQSAVRDRVRALVDRGIIEGFHARIDTTRMGGRITAMVDIRLRTPDDAQRFERLVRESPLVIEAMHLTGRADYMLRVACRDPGELDNLITALKRDGGVRESETRLVLRTLG